MQMENLDQYIPFINYDDNKKIPNSTEFYFKFIKKVIIQTMPQEKTQRIELKVAQIFH